MPGGRPTKLIAKITVDGERTTVHDAIVALVRQGRSPSIASRLYGITAEVVWKWIRQGRDAQLRLDEGKKIPAADRVYLRFVHDLDRAWAGYVADYEDLLDQLAHGGLVLGTVVETVNPMTIDPRTNRPEVLERKVTTSRTLPDIRAIRLVLERRARHEGWAAQAQAVDEATEELDDRRDEREAELLAAIEQFKAGLDAGQAFERERDVIEASASEHVPAELPAALTP